MRKIDPVALDSVIKKKPTQFPESQKNVREVDEFGYPIYFIGGTAGWVYCHRLAYALEIGVIPDGKDVIGTCGNKMCVNPKHLALVDDLEL